MLPAYFAAPYQTSPEIVKRWSNEVQEAVQSRAALVQFHALALLHQVCYLNVFLNLTIQMTCLIQMACNAQRNNFKLKNHKCGHKTKSQIILEHVKPLF